MNRKNKKYLLELSKKQFPTARFFFFRSGDLYTPLVAELSIFLKNFKFKNKLLDLTVNFIKLIIYLISNLYWYPIYIKNKIKFISENFDFIITDPWASKLFFTFKIKYKFLILQDGGSSTDTFKLIDTAFNYKLSKPLHLVEKSLKEQKVKMPLLFNLVYKKIFKNNIVYFMTNKFYLLKSLERMNLNKRYVSKPDWFKTFNTNEILNNNFKISKNEIYIILGKSPIGEYLTKLKSTFKKENYKKIYIRVHPNSSFKTKSKNKLIKFLKNYSKEVIYVHSNNPFELDILEMSKVPSIFLRHHDCSTNAILHNLKSKNVKLLDL